MLHLGEARSRGGTDPPRWGIVGDELGMLVLESLELVVESVVAGVGDLRVVENVVAVRMVL